MPRFVSQLMTQASSQTTSRPANQRTVQAMYAHWAGPAHTAVRGGTLSVGIVVMLASGLAGTGCRDVQTFTTERETPRRPVGAACIVNDDCDGGRCVGGICQDDGCENDEDCLDDEICVFRACRPVDDFACQPDQAPLVSLAPAGAALDFGRVSIGEVRTRTLTVTNTGDCLLTLQSAGLSDAGDSGFSCEPCDPRTYPQRVPPRQSLDIHVTFSPQAAGAASNTLYVRTDDVTAGDRGLLSVPVVARYDGDPVLVITPAEVNFGRVDYTAGGAAGSAVREVEITNRGSGNASLVIERIFVNNGVAFSIPAEFNAYNPDNPLLVPPFDPNNSASRVLIPITFTPNANRDFQDELVVRPQGGSNVIRLLRGTSLGPPQINVSATSLVFQCGVGLPAGAMDPCPTGEAYPVGTVAYRTFSITNTGQSELNVTLSLSGESGDFSVSPSFIQPIGAGGSLPITVYFQPTGPSDPLNRTAAFPAEAFDAVLNILSDDTEPPTDALQRVVLTGYSRAGQFDQALKLEMEFQNADNSWAGNDYRDVDLELESPLGYACRKNRDFMPDGAGGFLPNPAMDPCREWNESGLSEGRVSWLAAGQYEEPERIILHSLGPTDANDGVFKARVHYMEDCANIPTGLLADILGIGGSVLLGWLGGSIGVPINVPPDQLSDFISENCFDREDTTVTVHIALDGQVVASPQVRLSAKGESKVIANLRRTNGVFCDAAVGIPCP